MSKARDIARAEGGHRHVTIKSEVFSLLHICASCHRPSGQLVKISENYFHPACPKRVVPLPAKIVATEDKDEE